MDGLNTKLDAEYLNYVLQHNGRLDRPPEDIETDVIYRLSLASNTKGSFSSFNDDIREYVDMFRCLQT